ncbi:unnamed protein product [Meganyctiphanes norvegica]|uniref:Calcineurin-like phosphoesterase domain-containing protein n=1 Tax=Meganyctiphanes norvegica TaxID=48144 RepID=A0AAV2R8T2_MEGNR
MTPKPKFLVICGDLLEAFPETEPKLREKQEKDFKNVFSALDIPLLCVCGNHDIGNTPTEDTIATYRSSFGDDYFSFWCGGVYFIVINSQFYENDSKVKQLSAEHETWLEQQLEYVKREQPKHSIVLQHIPWFQNNPDEPKNPWNFEKDIRTVMLKKYYDAGIRHIYCGHYHRNGGGFYKDMELVVTAAVEVNVQNDGTTPSNDHGYRVVKVLDNKLEHSYYELGTAPSSISWN